MNTNLSQKNDTILPKLFRSILWSYDFNSIDLEKDRKTIIVNAINYGNLKHWRWISGYYGQEIIKGTLESVPVTEIRSRAAFLASIIFSINKFNYACRGAK
ncbi:MAG: hypothetical protein CO139_02545 [Candidatus Moranbacteria bacterium CG_4_9_14_3_um_filter_36_9]|nr:MAG: hypothetical protein CO139_02545 [Candidatus Moranbacteria bacterium CG_4_9_14_3_um_filter_36_9]